MMMDNRESVDLLRETLAKYVKDLADELFYWVEELNKLDGGNASTRGAEPASATLAPNTGPRLG
jgi:hypothetical protein